MKTCTRCGETRDDNEHGKYARCRQCRSELSKEYYHANKERERAKRVQAKSERSEASKAALIEYLSTQRCVDCGESDLMVLEFDHLGDKEAMVTDLVRHGYSWETIKAEIDKCDVVCCNCHRRRTYARVNSYRHQFLQSQAPVMFNG